MVQHHEERLTANSSRTYVYHYITAKYGEGMRHVDDEHLWSKQSNEAVKCLTFLKMNISSCTKATCYKIISLLDHSNIDIRNEAFEIVSSLLQDKSHTVFSEESSSLVNEIFQSTYYDDARDNILALLQHITLKAVLSTNDQVMSNVATEVIEYDALLPHHNQSFNQQRYSLTDNYNNVNANDASFASYMSSSSSSESN